MKEYSKYANRGRGIQISGHRRPPIYRTGRGNVTHIWNFGTPSISWERLELSQIRHADSSPGVLT